MKKLLTTVLLFISILSGLFVLNSCQEKELENNEQTQIMIKEDLIKTYLSKYDDVKLEEIEVSLYLGIYNNSYVAIYESRYWGGADWKEEVAGFVFTYYNCPILVWKDHSFYNLKDAYEKGFLSIEDIELINIEFYKVYTKPKEIK